MKVARLPWLAAALLLVAAPLRAQTLFGLIQEENPANNRDLYRLRVRQEVTALLGGWKRAWDADNARAAADLYTRDGLFVTPVGDETRTRDSLRVKLAEVFTGAGALTFSVQDFDFSGEMAYARGQMAYAAPGGDAQIEAFVLVARRQRDDVWLIRSLTLIPQTAATPAAAPTAAAAPAAAPPSAP
jgi:uncharacterized protein (TIGR02246 family)